MSEMRVIAELGNYDAMIAALSARAAALGVSQTVLDELAGLSAGYTGQVFGGSQTKRLGWLTTWLMLPVLGARLVLIEDAAARTMMEKHYGERRANQARKGNYASPVSKHVLSRANRHFSRLGNKARWRGTTKEERSEHGRKMAMARWKRRERGR
jgi:hypothetical protein